MSNRRKSPGANTHRHHNNHTPTVKRWVKRKKEEAAERREQYISDAAAFGSVHKLYRAKDRVSILRAKKAQQEREMLATTSLKDLIK